MPNFVVLDVETTQNPTTKKEEIIEFACIECDEHFSIIQEFSSLVNPSIPLSFITKKVTGILDVHLKDQPTTAEILPKIDACIKGRIIIAHNASFDLRALINAYSSCNATYPPLQVIDSLKIAKKILLEEKVSLSSLKQKFNITIKGHRAKEDVLSLYQILKHLAMIYESKNTKSFLNSIEELWK